MGTDFNFLYSGDMKKQIIDNCPESYKSWMELETYHDPMNSDWQVFLNRNVNDVQFENDISEIIQNAYTHSSKFYIHGALGCVYFLSAVITFLNGLSAFFDSL